MIYIELECPYCKNLTRLRSEDISQYKVVMCTCGQQIPTCTIYDKSAASK